MTKADLVTKIANETKISKESVAKTVELMMESIKESLSDGNNVYLRGFGSFVVKKRAEKTGRNISKNTTIIIPEHFVPAFKPAKVFVESVKESTKK
jgi:DNA-binding protein HU-beta|tara:strand:- start:384695 stop:384982 length:288 start_codon:yes stop_codon:yes gene_type:complete